MHMKDKFLLSFGSNDGRSADLELCVFCERTADLNDIGTCEHFADGYDDNQCVAFVPTKNTEQRIQEALDIKCGKIKSQL